MKILIHALGAELGGAVRHLNNFIPALLEEDKKNTYYLLIKRNLPFTYEHPSLKIKRIESELLKYFLFRIFIDVFYTPYLMIKINSNIVVSILNFGPVFHFKPHINFQRNALYFYSHYLDSITGLDKLFTKLRASLLYLTMRFANVIVTPSDSMRELIKSMYPSLSTKLFMTLYHGFNIQECEGMNDHWERILTEDTRVKMLYPTHPAPHKGFEILFEALAKYKTENRNNNFALYTTIEKKDWPKVVGKYEEQIKQLDINENIVFTGRISQDQMPVFYKNCDLMIYPSLCESFGFSMIEAMGYGLPIIAADTAINQEICQDAAIYYSAFDPNDAAEKIFKGLNESVREDLKQKAKKRLISFDWSWERYAKEFLKIIKSK